MYLVTVDSATEQGGVALFEDCELRCACFFRHPRACSREIVPALDSLLSQHHIALSEVGCFVVASGPGSFTGLRVGLAAVKAWAQVAGRPVVALSTLETLAYRFRHESERVAPMMDARRHQVFAARYRTEAVLPRPEGAERVLPPEIWLQECSEEWLLVGDGTRVYRDLIERLRPRAPVLSSDNRILEPLGRLGWESFRRHRARNATEVAANYLRPSDAELNRPALPDPGSSDS